ncbi:MAG: RluA family pseudouridine synthase [Clostridia bacterium]|nr:RluA family pseudouridine synthase [Clostridia bacterium]
MEHLVTAAEDGRRLRDMLRQVMQVSYTQLKSAKWGGRILVDGLPRTVDQPVRAGEIIAFLPDSAPPVYRPKPCFRPVPVAWEDEHLLIIDKPAPLASQSSARQPDDTLENMVYVYLGQRGDFIYRPVNRLDKGTSGLMAVAKTAHAQQLMQRLLHTPQFTRRYLAVVEGCPEPLCGTVSLPIAKEDAASIRRIVTPEGKPSVTHYETLRQGTRSLVRLTLETGRTHQIRVHMSAVGCPVCGDFLYGTELEALPGRFALHSAEIDMIHPVTREKLHITSPLPEELARLMED